MNTWIKCLCAFLLTACVCYVFQETIEARGLLGLLSGNKESTEEQSSRGAGLLQIVDGLTDAVEKTVTETANIVNVVTDEGELLTPLGLGDTAQQLTEVVKSTVNTVTETTSTVTREVEKVTNEVGTVLTTERHLLSEQGITQLVQDVAGTVDSTVGAVVKTVETAASGTEGIVKNVEETVVSTKPLLPVPGLVDGIGNIVGGVGETVGSTGDLAANVGDLVSGLIGTGQNKSKPEDSGVEETDASSSEGNETSPYEKTGGADNPANSNHSSESKIPEKYEEIVVSGNIGNEVQSDYPLDTWAKSEHTEESDIQKVDQNIDSGADIENHLDDGWPLTQLGDAANKGFKGTAANKKVQSKASKPNQSHLPPQKKNKGVHPFNLAVVHASTAAKNGTSSSGGGSSSIGGVDMILFESVSDKEVGRRNIPKNTRQLITKWANEPPTEPPQHFLFSIFL